MLDHWSYNAVVNSVQDASQLDGWGDLARGMVTFHVVGTRSDVEVYRETEETGS